jgi:PPOX class probable F420-dependent enzyme
MPIDPVYRTTRGLSEEVRNRMSKEGNAILATIGDDGAPHLTELLFMLDEQDRVLLPTPHNTRKLKNVRARPVATAFFHEQPDWVSCTGTVRVLEGDEAERTNQRIREHLLTESGLQTIGRVLAAHEDTTIVLSPTKWLAWSGEATMASVIEMGADLEANPPDTWFRDMSGPTA